ncbi:MAG: hypothetical protein M3285_12365 [Actinomycetota bacterium]|nr:hypothetical protein [Actinomycetota bacterium]
MANRRRLGSVTVALALLVPALAVVMEGNGVGATELTPDRTILVITANLREAHPFNPDDIKPRYRDLQRLREMRNFAQRLGNKLKRAPDVLLLQEVLEKSSRAVARALSNEFGMPFRSIVHSTRFYPGRGDANPLVVRETAIVINERSMKGTSQRGYVHTLQRKSDPPAGVRPVSKAQAYALVRERESGATFAAMSVHLMTRNAFASFDVAKTRRNQWTNQLTEFMANEFPSSVPVIGGDFNETRCVEWPERVNCALNPFWDTIANSKSYTDSVFEKNSTSDEDIASQIHKRIDFIFTGGDVEKASHDTRYDKTFGDRKFISDHKFVRSRIAAPIISP